MQPGHISSAYLLSLLRILERMGYPRARSVEVGELDAPSLVNPKYRVPVHALQAVFDDAALALDEPDIGLQVGYRFRVATFTETGSILALCGTLAEAAQINAMYQPLAETAGVQTFERQDGDASMVWEPSFDDDERYRHVTELIMAGYVTTTNWLSWGYERGVDRVDFRHAAPLGAAGHAKVLGPKVRFGQARNALLFNSDTVDRPLPTSNPEKLAHVRRRLDVILRRARSESGLRERVAAEVLRQIMDQTLSFVRVSKALGLSERTLRRTLAQDGLSYRTVVADVRKTLCETYMRDGRSLTEIAHLLGYNDQSAFTRAFKGWYGVIPSQYQAGPLTL